MKIIEPSVELIKQTGVDMTSHIANIARVCYGKDMDGSNPSPTGGLDKDTNLIKRLLDSKHYSVFRHWVHYFILPINSLDGIKFYHVWGLNPYTRVNYGRDNMYISFNHHFAIDHKDYYNAIKEYEVTYKEFNNTEIGHQLCWLTFKCVTQISTSREFNRVSPNAITERSTRYVGYSTKQSIYDYNLRTEQGIIDAYLAGYSPKEIDINSMLSHHQVRKILINNGIELRPTKSMVNHHAFNIIDNAEKAYLLGLIESDGSVRTSHNELNITQHKDYYLYVKAIFDYILKDSKITNDKDCKKIYCFSEEVVNNLINIGIVENKTYNQTNNDIDKLINHIPEKYYNSFIRGIFDGDGSVGFYKDKNGNDILNLSISVHTERLRDFIVSEIRNVIMNDNISITSISNLYNISIHSRSNIIAFIKYLYKDFQYPFGHPNKTNKCITFLQDNNVDYDYNFSIANFGDNKFEICSPYWINKYIDNPNIIFTYIFSLYNSEISYKNLIANKMLKENARGILPLDTKTVVAYTYPIDVWKDIINNRYYGKTGKSHGNAIVLASLILDEINKLGYKF